MCIEMEKPTSDAIKEREEWITIPSMKNPRYCFGATVIEDTIYVAGGCNEQDRRCISSAEVYDCKSNKWSSLPDMNEKRDGVRIR